MEREQVPGNVFSSLAKGRGTWKGELELDLLVDFDKDGTPILPSLTREPSGFASSSNLGSMHRSKSATTLSTSSYRTEKSDGEINIPKTFITRSGALLLFTAPNNVELSAFQKQQLQKGLLKARRADVRSKFGTLTRFANSVLTFGDENYPKDSASISDTDNPVFLRFLHDLDNSDMVDLRAKPGADPAFYLRDLKARAHSTRSSKSGRVSSAHWQRAHTFSYGFGPEYHEEPEVSIVSPSPPLPQFPVDESDKLPSDSPRTGDNLQNYPYAVPRVREDSPQLSDEGQYVTAEEIPRKMDELLIYNEGESPKFSGFRGRAKSARLSPRYSSRSSIPERPLTTGSVLRASGDLLSADTGSLVAQYLDKSSSQHRSPNSAYARKYSASYHGSVPEMQQSNSSGDIARPNTPSSRASSTMSFHTQPLSGEGSRSSLKSRPGSVYDSGGISSAGSCVHSNIPTAITSVNISHKGAQHAAPPHPDSILAHPAEVRLDEEELPPHRKAWEKEDGCEDSIASYDMPDHDLMFDSAGGDMLHSVSMDDLDQINTHRRDSGRGDGLGAAHPLQAPYQGVGLMTVKAGSTFSISSSVPSEDREHMLAELENLPDSRQGERDDGIQSVISVEISRRGSSASVESLDPLDVVPSSESKIPSEDALPSHDSMHKKEPERVSTDEVLKEEVEMTISSKNGAPQYKSSTSLLDSHSDIHLNEENGDLKEKFSPPPSSFLHSETDIATKTPSEPLSKPGPPLPKSPSVTSSTKRTHTPPIRTDKLPVDITEGVSEISAQTGTRSSSSKGLDRRGSQPQYVQAFDITSVQSDKHAESPTSRQEIRAESVVNDTQAELTRLFGSVTPVKKPGKHGKSKGKKSVSIRQSPLPKKTKEEEDIDRLEEEVGTLLAATTENNENTEVGLSQEELELATEMLKEKVAIAEDRIQSAGKKDKKEKNKKNKKVGERKDLTEQKEKLRLQREEEKQRRLQEAQQLQQKIKEQAEEKQKHEEETDKRKTELADELSMIARAAEEARQMEEEARAALSAARKSTREEREAKRKADLERKKAEAAQKREEEKRLKEEGRRREREMLEKISTSEQRRKMAEEDRLRREEEEWEEEQARMEEENAWMTEEERLAKLALDEEARIAAHEKEAEEEAMEKLVAERLEMEKKRKLLEAESKRIQEEEELERRKLEEEQKKLEEEKRQQEEYLLKKQEEEQTRLNELRVMESEARKKMKDEMEKRRQAALARREVNLDRHNHLNGLKKEQGITKPWTFSYYVLWPRDNYEKLMGDDTTKKKRRSVKPKASSAPKS